ncbi:MAG: hypothetical protein FWD63_08625, partial [Propionibacteriaceae bacterium]|nr:hypothetical protein [Propionibacteriaceae bacterium]
MATSKSTKKVVQSTAAPVHETTWQPKPEDRAKANRLRLFAAISWVVAVAVECVAIFALILKPAVQEDPNDPAMSHPFFGMLLSQNAYFGLLIALIVVAGIFAVIGSLLWKQANRLDPASEKDTVRFFIQNQLGAIITLIAFIPLVILVAMDKNMKGAQKGIATGIAAVVLIVAAAFGVSTNSPSIEQYDKDTAIVMAINGQDQVFWVKGGGVFHLCQESSYLNIQSKDNTIYSGTVDQAHAAGKTRLANVKECGYDPANPPAVGA